MRKYINYLLILFAFSLPLKLFLINGLSVLISALWLKEGDLTKKWHILKNQKIFWLFIALSLLALLSLTWSDSIYDGFFNHRSTNGLKFWFNKMGYKLLILPVLLTTIDLRLFKQMMSAFLSAMFISEIISYGIFFKLWEFGRGVPEDPTPFLHHTYYSAFLIFTIFVALVRFQKESKRWLKYFYLLFALSATINLFLNGGRTGQLAFLFAAIYFATHFYRLTIKSVTITLITLTLLYTIAYNSSPVFKARMQMTQQSLEMMQKGELQTSFGQRVAIWQCAWDIIKTHPLLGVGMGSAKKAIATNQKERYPDRPYICRLPHIHNQFIQTYLESGIVGLLLLLMLFYLLFSENFYEYTVYARIYAISLLMLFLVDVPLRFNYGINYILLFTGLFFGYKIYKEQR
jgi:O-antigen ligase